MANDLIRGTGGRIDRCGIVGPSPVHFGRFLCHKKKQAACRDHDPEPDKRRHVGIVERGFDVVHDDDQEARSLDDQSENPVACPFRRGMCDLCAILVSHRSGACDAESQHEEADDLEDEPMAQRQAKCRGHGQQDSRHEYDGFPLPDAVRNSWKNHAADNPRLKEKEGLFEA